MRLAIAGASGRLGQLVAACLRAHAPGMPIRLLAPADLTNPVDLQSAFAELDVLFVAPTEGPPAHRLDQHQRYFAAAARARVGRLVYSSVMDARPEADPGTAHLHGQSEAALQASGLAWTILRNAPCAEAVKAHIAASMGGNRLIMPAAHAPIAYVPGANAAAAAAGAMRGAEHAGRVYTITGSCALAGRDIAALVGEIRGTPPDVIDADPWEYLQALAIPFGAPRFALNAMQEEWAHARKGAFAAVTSDAEHLAGQPLTTLPDFIRAATHSATSAGMPR